MTQSDPGHRKATKISGVNWDEEWELDSIFENRGTEIEICWWFLRPSISPLQTNVSIVDQQYSDAVADPIAIVNHHLFQLGLSPTFAWRRKETAAVPFVGLGWDAWRLVQAFLTDTAEHYPVASMDVDFIDYSKLAVWSAVFNSRHALDRVRIHPRRGNNLPENGRYHFVTNLPAVKFDDSLGSLPKSDKLLHLHDNHVGLSLVADFS